MHFNTLHYNDISNQWYERKRPSQRWKDKRRDREKWLSVCLCPSVNYLVKVTNLINASLRPSYLHSFTSYFSFIYAHLYQKLLYDLLYFSITISVWNKHHKLSVVLFSEGRWHSSFKGGFLAADYSTDDFRLAKTDRDVFTVHSSGLAWWCVHTLTGQNVIVWVKCWWMLELHYQQWRDVTDKSQETMIVVKMSPRDSFKLYLMWYRL